MGPLSGKGPSPEPRCLYLLHSFSLLIVQSLSRVTDCKFKEVLESGTQVCHLLVKNRLGNTPKEKRIVLGRSETLTKLSEVGYF